MSSAMARGSATQPPELTPERADRDYRRRGAPPPRRRRVCLRHIRSRRAGGDALRGLVARDGIATSEWCKKNVDPAKVTVPGFDKANTQAGEEAFSWLARAKHMFRHMNEARFLFIMLRLAHLRNRQLSM
jgi:hypothetical protein